MRLSSSNEKYQKIESEFKSSPKHFNFEENHKKTKPKFNFNFQYSENQNIINEPKFGKETYKQEITIPKNY